MKAIGSRGQSGAVLILVLWVTALLAVLLGAFSLAVRVERSVGSELLQQVRAQAAGDAVLNYLAAVRQVDEEAWAGMVGEVLRLPWRDGEVRFRFIPEASFVSLNSASALLLTTVFAGLELKESDALAQQVVARRNHSPDASTAVAVYAWTAVEELLTLGHGVEQLSAPEYFFSADSLDMAVVLDFAAPQLREILAGNGDAIEGYTPLPHEPEMFRVQVVFGEGPEERKAEFTVTFEEDGLGFRLERSHLFAARFDWSPEDGIGYQ